MENQKGSIESDPVTGTSNTSSAMATPPSLSFDSHTTPDRLDHTWVGSSPAEEMEEEGSAVHQNEVHVWTGSSRMCVSVCLRRYLGAVFIVCMKHVHAWKHSILG